MNVEHGESFWSSNAKLIGAKSVGSVIDRNPLRPSAAPGNVAL